MHRQPTTLATALLASLLALACLLAPARAAACPFCNAVLQTLSEELADSEAAVVARLIEPMPELPEGEIDLESDPDEATATFEVLEVLRGENRVSVGDEIAVVYFGDDPPEHRFLITSFEGLLAPGEKKPDFLIDWGTPTPLGQRAVEYLKQLLTLPKKGNERLAFFQKYFEDEDPLLRQDAYDEFARAPYEEIEAFADLVDRERILGWIDDSDVGPSSRRLYLTLLGVCGTVEDVPELEKLLNFDYLQIKPAVVTQLATAIFAGAPPTVGVLDDLIRAEERRKQESLDALIACYLKLRGPEGLELVNRRFFENPQVSYQNMYSAIMALRFHGEETEVLPREQLLDSMRSVLDHPKFADQVITDLTRWEDWEIMPRLVRMFKESEEEAFIRLPVASYLQIAAEETDQVGVDAKRYLAELKELDPETIKRTEIPSSFGMLSAGAARPKDEVLTDEDTPIAAEEDEQEGGEEEEEKPVLPPNPTTDSAVENHVPPEGTADRSSDVAGEATQQRTSRPPAERLAPPLVQPPSRLVMVGVSLLAGITMFGVFAVLLRGSDPRQAHHDTTEHDPPTPG